LAARVKRENEHFVCMFCLRYVVFHPIYNELLTVYMFTIGEAHFTTFALGIIFDVIDLFHKIL
jgi:hypothetical protein